MSKYVKNLLTEELRKRLDGVSDALVVDVIGLDANKDMVLRRRLREKNMALTVVKNSLARRATEGTPLSAAFTGVEGRSAIVYGGEDIVTLAKEIIDIAKDKEFEPFAARGGVMGGERLAAEDVEAVSKWPSREELIATVAGMIMSVPSEIASQLTGPATDIAAQVKTLIERQEEEAGSASSE